MKGVPAKVRPASCTAAPPAPAAGLRPTTSSCGRDDKTLSDFSRDSLASTELTTRALGPPFFFSGHCSVEAPVVSAQQQFTQLANGEPLAWVARTKNAAAWPSEPHANTSASR